MTEKRNASPKPQIAIEKLPKVVSRTGLSAASIYRLIALKQFPEPTKLSAAASGWFADEIDQWLEARRREPNKAMGLKMGRKAKIEGSEEIGS
jgi:prophage regulatory protein